eukprot:534018-Prorocentrum_minimum.AAC.2
MCNCPPLDPTAYLSPRPSPPPPPLTPGQGTPPLKKCANAPPPKLGRVPSSAASWHASVAADLSADLFADLSADLSATDWRRPEGPQGSSRRRRAPTEGTDWSSGVSGSRSAYPAASWRRATATGGSASGVDQPPCNPPAGDGAVGAVGLRARRAFDRSAAAAALPPGVLPPGVADGERQRGASARRRLQRGLPSRAHRQQRALVR